MTTDAATQPIPGTILFNGHEAMKGYALNKMCFSFNSRENREAFVAGEEAYMDRFGLTEVQKQAIRHRNVLETAGCGRQHLLPGEVRRNFRLGRPGHRSAANRRDAR